MAVETTVQSQAGPFVIRVLDGPLATQILMQGQSPGFIVLEGRSLPYRPISFEGKQRVKTTWYAGNTVATQQVMGPTEEPTIINGVWRDKYLGNNTARNLAALFDQVRRAGSLVRVSWGRSATQGGPSFQREGIITRTKFTPDRPQDVAWEVEFTWRGQTEVVAPVISAAPASNPRDGFADLRSKVEDLIDATKAFINGKVIGIPFQALQNINNGVDQLENVIGILGSGASAPATLAAMTAATAERLIGVASLASETAQGVRDDYESLDDLMLVPYDDAIFGLRTRTTKIENMRSSTAAKESAAQISGALADQLFPEVIAEERPAIGSDLRDLAAKYYGDPDLWYIIASFNNLFSSKVPDLPSGPSDDPGPPIFIPRRTSNAFGDLRRVC